MATKRTPTKKARAAKKRKSKAPSKKATKTATKKRASKAPSKKSATKATKKRESKAPAKKSRSRKSVPSPSRPTVPAKPRAKRRPELSDAAAGAAAEPVTPAVREAVAAPPSVSGCAPSSRPPSYLEGVPQDRVELVSGLFQVFRGVAKDLKTLVSQAIVLIDDKENPPKR